MKSPLNINSKSNAFPALTLDQTRILKGILGLVISILVFVGVLVYLLFSATLWVNLSIVSIFITVVSSIALVYLVIEKNKLAKYKLSLEILQKTYPDLKYNDNQYVSVYSFTDSELYDEGDYFYRGNDLIQSEKWDLSNIKVKCNSNKSNKENKIFKGCLLNYKKEIYLNESIIIKPKHLGQNLIVPTVLNQLMNPYFNSKKDIVETGFTAFDQLFHIYSSDSNEASSFLTEDRMTTILSFYYNLKQIVENQSYQHKNRIFKPKFDKPLNALELSFQKDGIYIAVREQKIFTLLEDSLNTKHKNIILNLINYLDKI